MARCIGHDELAARRREETISDIDGDALLTLSLQPVHQKCEIKIIIGGAKLPAVVFQRGKLVLKDELRIIKKPPDQGRFAVIDGTAGEKAQKGFVFLIGQKIGNGSVLLRRLHYNIHQK
ncbi:sulfate adenylyltransferase subunit 1 domain protein [Brucella abortus bv. 6 str. 870]|nr:sulfate adenylyltransferase subunit 1 domain protein [Brucella abortus]AIJ64126.1 sulfate adenylyltransferase subunit 1 domain protein [Brucella abortus bv. 6 str. 870]